MMSGLKIMNTFLLLLLLFKISNVKVQIDVHSHRGIDFTCHFAAVFRCVLHQPV